MKGQELKIIFKTDLAFLTEEVALDFNQVQIAYYPVKFQAPAYWTVRVINHIENENRLHVEVLSYEVGETEFSSTQLNLSDILISIDKVTFKSIDTFGLLGTLKSKEPVKILPAKQETVYRQETQNQTETRIERTPVEATYNEPFSVPLKDVTFLSGKVVFEKKIQYFKKAIEFEIINENLLEEYDAIKNYFANVLKTKKIQVVPEITEVGGIISSISATSIEIDKIDQSLIAEVKYEFLTSSRSKAVSSNDQLFTIDEYLVSIVGEDFKKLHFFKDEHEFFETVLEKSETKHYKQLSFLSSKHKPDILKLRLVHNPFSFVFLLSSEDKFHIVWETLDTQEATYIWTVHNDSDLKEVIKQIDRTISEIIKNGKSDYINRKEENFKRVFHDYTDLQNGFKKWKADLEQIVLR